MRTLTNTAKHNLSLIGIAAFVLLVVVTAVLIFSPRNVASGPVGATAAAWTQSNQNGGLVLPLVTLEGDWAAKDGDLAFQAKVDGNSIKIEMLAGDGTSATYWHGTFKPAESPNVTIVSDKTEANDEIVLSQSSTKDFKIGTDGISFKFSAMGFSKQVTLKR